MSAKNYTYYRKSKNGIWYRVHYENIKVGDIVKIYNDKKWEYFKVTSNLQSLGLIGHVIKE